MERLTKRKDLRTAADAVAIAFTKGASCLRCSIGVPSQTWVSWVLWRKDLGVWMMVDGPRRARAQPQRLRYGLYFGVSDPTLGKTITPAIQVNIPLEGVNRRLSGAAAFDEKAMVCLLHTGRVNRQGGGGGHGFRDTVAMSEVDVTDEAPPDRTTKRPGTKSGTAKPLARPVKHVVRMLLIGRIEERGFDKRLAEFVLAVAAYKGNHETPNGDGPGAKARRPRSIRE